MLRSSARAPATASEYTLAAMSAYVVSAARIAVLSAAEGVRFGASSRFERAQPSSSKKLTTRGRYAFTIYAQVNNMFDKQDIYNVNAAGVPVTTDVLPVWNAPRTYLGGITIDMDWTR